MIEANIGKFVKGTIYFKDLLISIFLLVWDKLPVDIDPRTKSVLVTSTDISAVDHLEIVTSLQTVVDKSVSKTINLRAEATVSAVREIYEKAYLLGLIGMTMYREGSSVLQPIRLK